MKHKKSLRINMMASSNGNIFRAAGPLWGNPPFTGDINVKKIKKKIFTGPTYKLPHALIKLHLLSTVFIGEFQISPWALKSTE